MQFSAFASHIPTGNDTDVSLLEQDFLAFQILNEIFELCMGSAAANFEYGMQYPFLK